MKLKERLEEFEYDYSLDQRELAKLLIVASTTLLFFSVHGITTLSSSSERISELESDYSRLSGMIWSEDFNRTVEGLQDVQGGGISRRMNFAAEVLAETQSTGATLKSVEEDIEGTVEIYQWLVLIAILGEVAGVSLIYI